MNIAKHALALLLACTAAAAQDSAKAAPEKIAVHAFGASDAGINKALGSKLLAELAQSGKYAEIPDHHAFQDELAKSGSGSMAQAAKRRGADIVCAVSIVEVFGAYSVTASMQKTQDSQVLKTASIDRSLNSLEDLSKASRDIAAQLLGLPAERQPAAEAAPLPVPVVALPKPVVALPKPKPAAALPKPVPKAPGGISSTCLAEFMFVSEKYEMAELVKKLGVEAVKVKAQSKAPLQFLLGPGPNDKVTDAGMTVGCLKAFPESASEAQALLKDLAVYAAFKLGKDFAANKDSYDEDGYEDGYYASRPNRRTQEPFLELGVLGTAVGDEGLHFRWSYSLFYNTLGYSKWRVYNDYEHKSYTDNHGYELILGLTNRWAGEIFGFGLFGGIGANFYSYDSKEYDNKEYYSFDSGDHVEFVHELGMEIIIGYASLYLSERNFDRVGLGMGLTFWRDKK
ncbi:MAG: hypothetical protein LBH25_13400 [Fibromonadaceae bacterium]|jgi:hypothetical protein|nr:hypothetical protein [Fibromonadaceae bacterium]